MFLDCKDLVKKKYIKENFFHKKIKFKGRSINES